MKTNHLLLTLWSFGILFVFTVPIFLMGYVAYGTDWKGKETAHVTDNRHVAWPQGGVIDEGWHINENKNVIVVRPIH